MAHYLSRYSLTLRDVRQLGIRDVYSVHRAVYDLFEDVRKGDRSTASGILFADKGFANNVRIIDILSDRMPRKLDAGQLETKVLPDAYFAADIFRFEVNVHPVRRKESSETPIRGEDAILAWFADKASQWGFAVDAGESFMQAYRIEKISQKKMSLAIATIRGLLRVSDRPLFMHSVRQGIGRGKAFGCGLLQVVPVHKFCNFFSCKEYKSCLIIPAFSLSIIFCSLFL